MGTPTDRWPVLAACGWSGSGKTTLLVETVRRLVARGLRIAVLKHDVHGLDVDREGKDSDRLFRAGANVLLEGEGERLVRERTRGASLEGEITALARRADLVLVEGHKGTPLPKVWCLADGERAPPEGVTEVLAVLGREADRPAALLDLIETWLPERWRRMPARGAVLLGGGSTRMGRPKHLIEAGGRTWLERTVERFAGLVESTVLLGAGEVPPALRGLDRLPDAPGLGGPVAGLLAAMRWDPDASWLVAACDLLHLVPEALVWLLSARAPGRWATLPRLAEDAPVEPLLAHYDPRARGLLEAGVAAGRWGLRHLAGRPEVHTPVVPAPLAGSWRDVDARLG